MIIQFSFWTAGLVQTVAPALLHGVIHCAVLSALMGVILLAIA